VEPLGNFGITSLGLEGENNLNGLNGGTTSGRSVSNTVRDRSRQTSTSAPSVNGGSSTTVGRHHHSQSTRNSVSSMPSHHHYRHNNRSRRNDWERISSASSPTSTAKESFLNFFFGQNGLGPIAGANITSTTSEVDGHLNRPGGTVGRDVSGQDSLSGAFMRTKNGPAGEGSDPAFDMKIFWKAYQSCESQIFVILFGVTVHSDLTVMWSTCPNRCGHHRLVVSRVSRGLGTRTD
jgi:dynamin 1-like protein